MLRVLPYPAIDPVIFTIGPFSLRWYALAYIAGIVLGWWYLGRMVMNDRLWGTVPRPTRADIDDFILWATLGIVLGGRIGFVLLIEPDYYLANPGEIFQIWKGGMAFHGGLIGVTIAMALFCRRKPFHFLTLADLTAAATPIGIMFGRIANFINGELYGRPTDVPWAVVFPNAGPEPRHPSQIYEGLLEGVLLFLVLRYVTHRTRALQYPGLTTGIFAIGYGIGRSIGEIFRYSPPDHLYAGGYLTIGMLLSFPMIVIGALICWWALRRGPVAEAAPDAAGPEAR